jgi:hypothetical protein
LFGFFTLNEKLKNNHKTGIFWLTLKKKDIKKNSKFDVLFGMFALLWKLKILQIHGFL